MLYYKPYRIICTSCNDMNFYFYGDETIIKNNCPRCRGTGIEPIAASEIGYDYRAAPIVHIW